MNCFSNVETLKRGAQKNPANLTPRENIVWSTVLVVAWQVAVMCDVLARSKHSFDLLSSETTAKGTGLAESAGKEDPVELDSSLTL